MFKPLGSVMSERVSASPILKGAVSSLVVETANQVLREMFGEMIDSMAQAMYLKHKALTVACMNSSIAQELKLREQDFLMRLAKKNYGAGMVDRLSYLLE
jgi:hypothetical protein